MYQGTSCCVEAGLQSHQVGEEVTEKPIALEALSSEKTFSHGVARNVTDPTVKLSTGFFVWQLS